MTAGDISPGWRIGTLEGELCSTVAIGVLVEVVEGMVRMSSNERVTQVKNWTLEKACLSMNTHRIGEDSGRGEWYQILMMPYCRK
jgi:hypothetical protein